MSHRFPDIVYLYFQKYCDPENIGQGHNVQHSQWHHSMASINLYKIRTLAFFANSYRFPDIKYYMNSRNFVLLKI